MVTVKIDDNKIKKEIAEKVLRDLPSWFGIESSTKEYIEGVASRDFYAAIADDEYVGFMSITKNNELAVDLYVLGILKDYHRKKIGTKLYYDIEDILRKEGIKYVTVQTLSAKSTDENYAVTRKYYEKLGFVGVFFDDNLWGESNPFMLMVKYIG